MYPGTWAVETPNKAAAILASTGETLTYRELDDRSNQLAQLFYANGLRPGDHVCIFADNDLRYFEYYWAAIRSGLFMTAINRYLQPDESAYIVNDSEAQAVCGSASLGDLVSPLVALAPDVHVWLSLGGELDGFEDYEEAIGRFPATPLEHQPRGDMMLYSSGTTGRPKGIKRVTPNVDVDDPNVAPGVSAMLKGLFAFDADSVYLSPAPLYHSAPLAFCTSAQSLGATCVVMERFDAAAALDAIDNYEVTHSQWVPTMFGRILKLADTDRQNYSGSTHKVAIHAAAPCPVEVKQQMFDFWGPIIHEYYAGTEVNGFTHCKPHEWLERPGTVGKSILGVIHICDDDGEELEAGQAGTIYFEREAVTFEYHNDASKTKASQHPNNPLWSTLGDVGFVDDEGYLFLTDRKAFMIIAGGVNIYPQEIEDCLIMHPKVADVAVIGVPNEDLGEEVKAVVQLEVGEPTGDGTSDELMAYASRHLARFKVPRSIDFREQLPRLPTGKLYKRLLRDEYWPQAQKESTSKQ